MKKIMILIILVTIVMSCSYFEAAAEENRKRGRECYYNHKGDFMFCDYIN